MNFYISGIILVSSVQLVASTATLTLPPSANCGDPAVFTCASSGCQTGYKFNRDNKTIYNQIGPISVSDPDRYSATVRSDTQVQLTITNIQYSDAVEYACNCGFYDKPSTGQTLVYQCKASTSSTSITSDKKLSITVDKLYPEPSRIVTTNTTDTIKGEHMCWPSSTEPPHFRCIWGSNTSFPDGIHNYTIVVTTGTQAAAAVSGSFRIVTPTSPNVSSLVISNRQIFSGVQDTPMTIQCVSMGGIPAPTLAWYRGNTTTSPLALSDISDSEKQSDGTYTVNLTYSFTPNRTDDLTPMLCRVFYPGATTGASRNPTPTSAILYLELKPLAPVVSQIGQAVVSGRNMTLRCTSSNGRPAPNITWSYGDEILTPTNTFIYNTTLETYTAVSVLERPVNAEDNGQTAATCRVSHTTLTDPLTLAVNVDVKFGPKAKSTTISGNQETPATDTDLLRLNCTSGSSNPASNITWFNGSNILSNAGNTTWIGENNGVITSTNLTITPTRYMDGNRITCRSDNGYGNDSSYVDLDIQYSPLIQDLQIVTAIEDEPNVTLTCSASSKPPAMFTWHKENMVLASGMGAKANNSLSYMIPRANRTDAGRYRCQAKNFVGNPDSKDVLVLVKYPPTVTVSTTTSPPYTFTCAAEGYPDNYTYKEWVQIWPGYGPVNTIPFNGTTLTLTNVTYMSSGMYVCNATNGIAVYGTDMRYMQGNARITINSRPIITEPFPDGTRVPVAGKLGQDVTTVIKYWPNDDDSDVKCYKLVNGYRLASSVCSVTKTVTNVKLPVYKHVVQETGTLATIKISLRNKTDLTDYDVVITNSFLAESVLHIYILSQDIKSQAESPSTALIAGIVIGVCTPLVIGVVVLIICWRKKAGRKQSPGKDIGNRSTDNSTSDVVECAVYESAGQSNTETKPQKPKKHTDVAGLYAVVSKPKKEARKAVHKSRTKDAAVYEIPEPVVSRKQAKPKKNVHPDGLIYADLEFKNSPKKSVIHGLDDATTYVQVDFTKAAEPLPDGDDEAIEMK